MTGIARIRFSLFVGLFLVALFASLGAHAASKAVDLDGEAANGAESQCSLNIINTSPVTFESKVTNKSGGDAFGFSWPSAGPGGFTSSVTAGTTGGVGARCLFLTGHAPTHLRMEHLRTGDVGIDPKRPVSLRRTTGKLIRFSRCIRMPNSNRRHAVRPRHF